MKNSILFSILLFVFIASFYQCTQKQASLSFPIHVGERPESITKGFEGDYFVTVMNGKDKGDGGVNKISSLGVTPFFRGADEPKGIVYFDEHLFFTDVNRIWKVDAEGKGEVFVDENNFPVSILYLNDICIDEKSSGFYVADMGNREIMWEDDKNFIALDDPVLFNKTNEGRVFHIDLNGNINIAQDTSALMPNPNGVSIDQKGNLMITGFFTGNILTQENNTLNPLAGQFRGADMVAQDKDGHYYVSSWKLAKLWKIDGQTMEVRVLVDDLDSAADFILEEDKRRILLPDMLRGKVYAVDL